MLGKILVSFANPGKIVGERNQERKQRRDGPGRFAVLNVHVPCADEPSPCCAVPSA